MQYIINGLRKHTKRGGDHLISLTPSEAQKIIDVIECAQQIVQNRDNVDLPLFIDALERHLDPK